MISFFKKDKSIISEKIIRKRIAELNARKTGILVSSFILGETAKYRISSEGNNSSVLKEVKRFKTNDDIVLSIERDMQRERIRQAAEIVFGTMEKTGEKIIDGETVYWKIEQIFHYSGPLFPFWQSCWNMETRRCEQIWIYFRIFERYKNFWGKN